MKKNYNYLFTFLVVFSAYLILCLPLAFATEMNKYVEPASGYEKTISFSPIATTLQMSTSDDFEPLKCDGEKYEKFTIFVDNYAYPDSYDIEEIVGTVVVDNQQFDVSDILSCNPTKNLVSNSQIRCSLDVESFIMDKLIICPPSEPAMIFSLSLTIKSSRGPQTLSLMKDSAIISSDVPASISIQSMGVQEVNCMLGSDIEALINVYHAETLGNAIEWGFVVNGTKEYGVESIDCSLVTEGDIGTGSKDNSYSCILRVPSLAFDECTEGLNFPVTVTAENEDFKINDSFIGVTVKKDLDLRLSVSSVGNVDCQIVSEDGDCVPLDPQREMSVSITGNGISNVETFAHKYRINDENFTTMSCKKASTSDNEQTYTCNIFLPRKTIPENPPDSETYSDASRINVTFETRYINTYGSISDEITIDYSGRYRDESTSILKELEEKKKELEKMRKIMKAINEIRKWINKIKCCCSLGINALLGFFADDGEALKEFIMTFLGAGVPTDDWGDFLGAFDNILDIVGTYGPMVGECIIQSMEKGYEENIEALNNFENDPNYQNSFEPLNDDYSTEGLKNDNPTFIQCIAENLAGNIGCGMGGDCIGIFKNFDPIKLLGCAGCLAIIVLVILGPLAQMCVDLTSGMGWWGWLDKAITAVMLIFTVLVWLSNKEILELTSKYTNARMEAIQENQKTMTDYAAKYQRFISDLAAGNMASIGMSNLFPPKPEAYISFNDSSGNLLNIGDTVCADEMITISYNFEKFSDIEGFENKIEIFNIDRLIVNTLFSTESSGEFKYDLKSLLKINIGGGGTGSDDGVYQFIFNYGTLQTTYRLNYQEVC